MTVDATGAAPVGDAPGTRIMPPDPDHPGWVVWHEPGSGYFNDVLGKLIARSGGDGYGWLRMLSTGREHANPSETIHGGAILGFVDIALFAAARMNGVDMGGRGQTIDCNVQFISVGKLGVPLDAKGEVLRETGKMVFVRGLLLQGDTKVAAFSGTIRKASPPR